MNSQAGKGDAYRKVDSQKWSTNYDAIFKKKRQTRKKDKQSK